MKRSALSRGTKRLARKKRLSANGVTKLLRYHKFRNLADANGVYRHRDGREWCLDTRPGRIEYRRRVAVMLERQGGECGLQISPKCPITLTLPEATCEHQDGRGMAGGKQDDRIEIDGVPYNLAACIHCNLLKGSRTLAVIGKLYELPEFTREQIKQQEEVA